MSLEFGKLDFAVSFNPLSAFPLDARSYFESYSEAEKAAQQAVNAGSTESAYYYGQTLVVVENNKASFYIIQPDNTLSAVASGDGQTNLVLDANQFEQDAEGKLTLKGYNDAEAGMYAIKGESGLIWQKPIDAYTKTETDEKIAAAAHLKRKVVSSIKEIEEYMANNNDADQYIYMVPTGLETDSDKYDEYMVVIITDAEGIETKLVEKVGSWEVNLNDYATKTYVDDSVKNKVEKEENARLFTLEEAEKLANLENSIIQSVETTQFSIENSKLSLKPLSMSQISGLEDALNNKVDAQEGYTLLSPTDQKKLNALVIGDTGLEISGKVNASNVEGLDEWIMANASSVTGLSENNFTTELYEKLNDMLFITAVDTKQLKVSAGGTLSIIEVDSSKITGLQEALDSKADIAVVEELAVAIEDLAADMSLYVTKSAYDTEIAKIWDTLTWQDIT